MNNNEKNQIDNPLKKNNIIPIKMSNSLNKDPSLNQVNNVMQMRNNPMIQRLIGK